MTTPAQLDREIANAMTSASAGAAIAARFLSVVPPDRVERSRRALDILMAAHGGAPIYNTEYKDAKDLLGRSVEEAYQRHIASPYLHGKGYTDDSALCDELGSIFCLHACISAAKKLAKLKPTGALGDALRTFFGAVTPVALIAAELKDKAIGGKKPNPDAITRHAQVAKEREGRDGECQICEHRQIVNKGKLVLHGYERPGIGFINGSCYGVGEPPWEVSRDALLRWIVELEKSAANAARGAVNVAAATSLTIDEGTARAPRPKLIKLGEYGFERERDMRVRHLEGQAERTTREARRQAARAKAWKPAP